MATKTLIAQEEYLRTSFEGPEPDYVDGDLVERPMPNLFHAEIQVSLSDSFKPWQDRKQLFRATEIRLRVEQNRFRVADFAIFASQQYSAIPDSTPYAVVEIVSPDDRYEEMMSKLADYQQAGIKFIFVADPPTRKLSRFLHGNLLSVTALELVEYDVEIPLASIFG